MVKVGLLGDGVGGSKDAAERVAEINRLQAVAVSAPKGVDDVLVDEPEERRAAARRREAGRPGGRQVAIPLLDRVCDGTCVRVADRDDNRVGEERRDLHEAHGVERGTEQAVPVDDDQRSSRLRTAMSDEDAEHLSDVR
jgi:hypothetical protein